MIKSMMIDAKNNFYITFGQRYSYEPHPTYRKAHPNGWVRIVAPHYAAAREKANELFEGRFATMYDEQEFDISYFPIGEIECFEV